MPNERNISLDLLKIFLATLVIAIHSDFPTVLQDSILCYLTKNGMFRISVPIFFIITGYYMSFFSEEKTKAFTIKILRMYLIWTLIYLYFLISDSFTPKFGEVVDISLLIGIKRIVKELILGYRHLWYLIAMFFSLLFFDKIRKIETKKNILVCVLLFLSGYILQYLGSVDLGNVLFFKKWDSMLYRNFIFFSTPFLMVGNLIGRHNLIEKTTMKNAISLVAFGGLLLVLESVTLYKIANLNDYELLLSLFLLCPSIFILVSKVSLKSKFNGYGNIATIMYLTHYIFIMLITKIGVKNSTLVFIVVLFSSALTGMVISYDYTNIKIKLMQLKVLKFIGL